jgi:hypothetical protein
MSSQSFDRVEELEIEVMGGYFKLDADTFRPIAFFAYDPDPNQL